MKDVFLNSGNIYGKVNRLVEKLITPEIQGKVSGELWTQIRTQNYRRIIGELKDINLFK